MLKHFSLPQDKAHFLPLLQKVILVVGASLLITLSAKLNIPFKPVPTTMQTFAIVLLGCFMGPRLAVASVILYLVQGFMGLPVFHSPLAGPLAFAGPSGGYFAGFIIAAYISGVLYQKGRGHTVLSSLALWAMSSVCLTLPGVAWVAYLTNSDIAQAAFLSYLPATILKIGLGTAVLTLVAHRKNSPQKA